MSRSGWHNRNANRREDYQSNTEADAAAEARFLGEAYDTDPREYDRPTRAEIEAEERGNR